MMISIRRANFKDAKTIYDWANDLEVRQNSIQSGTFSFEDHKKWLKHKLEDSNSFFYILTQNSIPCGLIRFDLEKESQFFLISFIIDKKQRGKGLSKIILKMGIDKTKQKKFKALVLETNVASIKAFQNLDFTFAGKSEVNNKQFLIFSKIIHE